MEQKIMKEEWKDIKGYEGYYEISNYGRVRSRYKILTNVNNNKFYVVYLSVRGAGKAFKVHRLVAKTFIPEIKGRDDVIHIDGNFLNNRVDNLKWSKRIKINMEIAEEIRSVYNNENISYKQLGERYNLHPATIGSIIRNKIWRV